MREWVVGFLFDDTAETVVLIRKNRPEWQKGKLNGVGGKIEEQDRIDGGSDRLAVVMAMIREFTEETGVEVPQGMWHHFATLRWEEGLVHFLRAFDSRFVDSVRTTTDEDIERHNVCQLGATEVTPNLMWLVPLAAHRHDDYDVIDVVETGTTLRKVGRLDVFSGEPIRRPEGVVFAAEGRAGYQQSRGGAE